MGGNVLPDMIITRRSVLSTLEFLLQDGVVTPEDVVSAMKCLKLQAAGFKIAVPKMSMAKQILNAEINVLDRTAIK